MMGPNAPYRCITAEMATIYPGPEQMCEHSSQYVSEVSLARLTGGGGRTGGKLLNISSQSRWLIVSGKVCAGLGWTGCFYLRCWRGMFGMRTVSAVWAQLRQVLGVEHRLEHRAARSDNTISPQWSIDIYFVKWRSTSSSYYYNTK